MNNKWFTADFHLGHANILRYCGRPFNSAGEMDQEILDRLNAAVAERDELYFLGDFCLGNRQTAEAYRRQIRCKSIYFVCGNHDQAARQIASQFVWFKDIAEIAASGQHIVLCHYAMRSWNGAYQGSWHLYGHSHGRLPDDPLALSMDVGVDTHDFTPWHLDEIKRIMQAKAEAIRQAGRQYDSWEEPAS
jgi:calcineurin-like phosphoesterase family protein